MGKVDVIQEKREMMKVLCITFLFISMGIQAQSTYWDRWDSTVLAAANTAGNADYMSPEEQKVVFFMNLARMDGPLFAETLLQAYVEENNTPNNKYLKSLFRDLKKLDPLAPLVPAGDLASIAAGHAEKSGRTGHVGHKDFKKRFEPVMGDPYTNVGENCSYGYDRAIDIVISLLIDEGVENLGHRLNILRPEFNSAGVAIRDHKSYRYNCVIDFGRNDNSSLNDLPF